MNVIANPVTCSHHSYGLPSATLRVAYYTISIRRCICVLAPGLVLRYVWRITQSASAGALVRWHLVTSRRFCCCFVWRLRLFLLHYHNRSAGVVVMMRLNRIPAVAVLEVGVRFCHVIQGHHGRLHPPVRGCELFHSLEYQCH